MFCYIQEMETDPLRPIRTNLIRSNQESSGEMFIECVTSDGLFTQECGVSFHSRSGEVELFVDRRLVHSRDGRSFLEAKKSSSDGSWTRVVLPQEPIYGSSIVEVATSKIRESLT
jgi:hypothetical protein